MPSSALDDFEIGFIIDSVARHLVPDDEEVIVIRKLLRRVLVEGNSVDEASKGHLVPRETLRRFTDAVKLALAKVARGFAKDAMKRSGSTVIADVSRQLKVVDGFKYGFAVQLRSGLDVYRCTRKNTCTARLYVNPATGGITVKNQHTHGVSNGDGAPRTPRSPTKANRLASKSDKFDKEKLSKVKSVAITKSRSAKRRFPCGVCGKRFLNERSLVVHRLLHSDKREFECDECGKRFAQPAGLWHHKRVHAGTQRSD